MKSVLDYIEKNILIFDGAMGTRLSEKGWDMKCSSEVLNITKRELVEEIHREYIGAGAKIITTNTFMCNIFNGEKYGYVLEEVVEKAVKIAKDAIAGRDIYIALSCGPSGEFFKTSGKKIDKVYENYKRLAEVAEQCGVDLILLETMMHLEEVKIAIKTVKENSQLPVFCTMSTWGGEKMFRDFSVDEMCRVVECGNGDAVGINCSDSPNNLYEIVEELIDKSNLPIMVKPNSGSIKTNGDKTIKEDSEEFGDDILCFIKKGVKIVGGCCGTNPNYITSIKSKLR